MAQFFQKNTPAYFVQLLSEMSSNYTFAHMIKDAQKCSNLSWPVFYQRNRSLIDEMQMNIKLMGDQIETDCKITKALSLIPNNLLKNNDKDQNQQDPQDLSNYTFG